MSFKSIIGNKLDLLNDSSNITGLPKIKYQKNINLNPFKRAKSLKKKFITYNINQKIEIIREMLNIPRIKKPFDGFAIKVNKCTVESLLQKSCEKDKTTIFEKNKLCKKNYPLIRFLSNRKTKNNTKQLLIEILSNEYRELPKAQEHLIKYEKYKPKIKFKNVNMTKYYLIDNCFKTDNIINELKEYKYKKAYNNENIFKNRGLKEQLYLTKINNMSTKFINTKSKFLTKNIKKLINNNKKAEIDRSYANLGVGKTIRLDNHEASKNNNNILLNRFIRKQYLSLKTDNYLDNEIIIDISKLKINNKIMPLNTKLLTI